MKKIIGLMVVYLISLCCIAEVLPLCPGESLIPLGGKKDWRVKAAPGTKAKISYAAGAMYFYCPGGKAAAQATVVRDYNNLQTGNFDQLVCYFNNRGQKIFATLKVTTDKGVVTAKSKEITDNYFSSMTDLIVDLNGAKIIKKVSLECSFANKSSAGTGIDIRRLIFRNKSEFADYLNYWNRFDNIKWDGLIKDESYNPTYKLRYGMLFSQDDLDAWRKNNIKDLAKGSFPAPEKAITPNIGRQRGFVAERIRKSGTRLNGGRTSYVAFQAILFKDKELMRLAARYLLSLCAVESWGDTNYPQPVGNGVISAFNDGSLGFDVAVALDCVGEMLTTKGYKYVLKMLMYKTFMPVTYSEWSRPFAFVSNQGPAFIRGKLAALLIAERHWKRVKPYTDLAKAELDEAVSYLFRADGSYMESSASYVSYTLYCMMPAYQNFAAMRKKKLSTVIPLGVSKSGAFAQILCSSSKNPQRVVVTIGQSHNSFNLPADQLAFMAIACPESMWLNLFNRLDGEKVNKFKKSMYNGSGITFSRKHEKLKGLKDATPKNLIVLKNAGLCSSWRDFTKIVFVGDAIGVGKKHNDVGSFVLEYAGDIYAMDMAVYAGVFSKAEYHNMLVALDKKGGLTNSLYFTDRRLYHNAKARNSMRPEAASDNKQFHAKINASKSWERKYFKKWIRTIDSINPGELTIIDEYKLGRKATGVAFLWNTYLPCKLEGNKITIIGEYGSKCEITAPADCEITLDKFSPGAKILKGMALPLDHKCTRIIIKKPGKANEKGKIIVKVKLIAATKK